ncbi:hypothetical protein TNCV_4868481 [Trichonephila clavipes]|nr:hypothetical protein TNCV_4868481 [Trichonephila clavipes]
MQGVSRSLRRTFRRHHKDSDLLSNLVVFPWSETSSFGPRRRCSLEYLDLHYRSGRGSRMVKVSDHGWLAPSSSPVPLKFPPCRGVMHIKSVESSNVLPLVWCGSWVVERKGFQLRCRPRHLTMVQNNGVRRQKRLCS